MLNFAFWTRILMICRKQAFLDCLFITLTLGVLFFFLLGSRALWVPDEGRYAEIAREMVERSDYITPYLNHIKYFEKPALFYWLGALAIKIGGLNLWSLRSVNALLAIFGGFMVYFAGSILYGRRTGLLAAFILSTSTLYFIMAHVINLDLAVSVFISCSLLTFLVGNSIEDTKKRKAWFIGMYAFAALATLTKGLIGIVFPLMIIGSWILLSRRFSRLKELLSSPGILVFFLIAAPWHILVSLRNPEFPYFYFVKQHFLRYTISTIGHYQPGWFFIPVILVGLFPWVVFLPGAIKQLFNASSTRIQQANNLFLMIWFAFTFIFFSISKSKLIPYILPLFPAAALLISQHLNSLFVSESFIKLKRLYLIMFFLCLIVLSATIALLYQLDLPNVGQAVFYLALSASVLLLGISLCYLFLSIEPALSLPTTIASAFIFLLFFIPSVPYLDTKSILPLAGTINALKQSGDEVITLNRYYQDLPFYLQQRVSVVNWRNELMQGMKYQDTSAWMIDESKLWQDWKSNKRLFLLLNKKDYNRYAKSHLKQAHLIAKTDNDLLMTNF